MGNSTQSPGLPSPLATSTPDGTPHLVPVAALGASAGRGDRCRRYLHRRRREAENDVVAAPARHPSTIHGPACSSTAMPMITQLVVGPADGVAAIHRDGEVMRAVYAAPLQRQICSIPPVPLKACNSSPALGQLARWTTTTA